MSNSDVADADISVVDIIDEVEDTGNLDVQNVQGNLPNASISSIQTYVGERIIEMRDEYQSLDSEVSTKLKNFESLRLSGVTSAEVYHSTVAAISARLQIGTTPGNPVLVGQWNDASANSLNPSYVEYNGLINSLGNYEFLGQYNGHSYFKNPQSLDWESAKSDALSLGAYLSSHQTIEENNAVAEMGNFRGWIGLYQDTSSQNYSEPSQGWKWVEPTDEEISFESITVEVYKSGALQDTFVENLNFTNNNSQFDIDISLNAELSKYDIKIYADSQNESMLIKEINDIVSGDVFIVQGQSNAAAVQYSGTSSAYNSDYVRVYAGGATSSSGLINNEQWYYGQGDGNENTNGNTGQWGLVLAKKLIDELSIPIAIFNGAHGGQPIEFFQRPSNYQTSTDSNYGRLFYRLEKTGLKDNVRGILWSQGESNSGVSNTLSTEQYKIWIVLGI